MICGKGIAVLERLGPAYPNEGERHAQLRRQEAAIRPLQEI
jgi:hypothetical protein